MDRRFIVISICVLIFTGCWHFIAHPTVSVMIDLQTVVELRQSESIFISGNLPQLGDWDASGLKFSRDSANRWIVRFDAPRGSSVEYKITRGSWNLEAMNTDCSVPGNSYFIAENDTTIYIQIPAWKDECAAANGGITGEINYIENFKSQYLDLPRNVIVWLPPGYSEKERYPVLYMHDGQNIIDPFTSYIGQDWKIDEEATLLISGSKMKKIIIVGIYSTELRQEEYSPLELGEQYTRFLINELKPFIDNHYPTLSDAKNTAVMGSSMGGLISFHLAWEHPDVFSMAGCLSPAFLVDENEILKRVKSYSGNKKPVKFYLDIGTVGLESELSPGFERMERLLTEKGYTDEDLKVFVDEGATHNEIAWSKRIHIPLLFFFGIEQENISH